jgi:hydrogenase expression/formation protein HypE
MATPDCFSASDPGPLQTGKLPASLLAVLLERYTHSNDPSVLVSPAPGFDAAVVRPGHDIIVKSDPITFATSRPGAYLVAVNANDIACLGGVPRWIAVTALFPEGTTSVDVARLFAVLADACRRINVSLIGGHTEITPSVTRLVLSGTMIGTPGPLGTLTPGGAQPGDEVWITQAAGIEGTSIIATEMPAELLQGIPEWALEVARGLLDEPGISIVEAAQIARENVEVTSMHDPTEGGVATALHELADASRLGIEVDLGAIPVWPVTQTLASHFDISPLGLISSGALLFTSPPGNAPEIAAAFAGPGIPVTRIATMLPDPTARVARVRETKIDLPRYDADELVAVLAHQ